MDDRRAQRVGGLVLLLGALAAAAVVVLDGADARRMLRIDVYMEHAGPLSEGDPVIVAGRDIGRVESISLVPGTQAGPDHLLGDAGGVVIRVGIERRYRDWTSTRSEIFVERRGVFGRPYLGIAPPAEPGPPARPLEDGDGIRGVDPARLGRVLRRATAGAVRVRAIAAEVEPSVRELGAELTRLGDALRAIEPEHGAYERAARSFASAGAELTALAESLVSARVPSVEESGDVLARASAAMRRAQAGLTEAARDLEQAGEQVPAALLERARAAVAGARASLAGMQSIARGIEELLRRIEEGRGTIGAILNDSSFSQDAKRVGRELMRQPWRFLGTPPER